MCSALLWHSHNSTEKSPLVPSNQQQGLVPSLQVHYTSHWILMSRQLPSHLMTNAPALWVPNFGSASLIFIVFFQFQANFSLNWLTNIALHLWKPFFFNWLVMGEGGEGKVGGEPGGYLYSNTAHCKLTTRMIMCYRGQPCLSYCFNTCRERSHKTVLSDCFNTCWEWSHKTMLSDCFNTCTEWSHKTVLSDCFNTCREWSHKTALSDCFNACREWSHKTALSDCFNTYRKWSHKTVLSDCFNTCRERSHKTVLSDCSTWL